MSTHAIKIEALNHAEGKWRHSPRADAGETSSRDVLVEVVAGYIDTAMAARQAHWIMRGDRFTSWHDAFGKLYRDLDDSADTIAERLVTLGSVPPGTVQVLSTKTSMEPFPTDVQDEEELTEALLARLGQLATLTRRAVMEFERLDDPVTVHHLTEATAVVEEHFWIVESHRRPN